VEEYEERLEKYEERLEDATLELLLQHFERYRLRRVDVEPDMLGQAYEYHLPSALGSGAAFQNPQDGRAIGSSSKPHRPASR